MHHCAMRSTPTRTSLSIEQATEIWLSRYTSANTRAAYSADLRTFFAWFADAPSALHATPAELTAFMSERVASGASSATVARQFAALRAFYGAACELGLRAENPFGLRPHAPAVASGTDVLTPDEATRLLATAALDPRTAVLVRLLLDEGMRLSEILGLDHADVSGSRHAKRVRIVRHGAPLTLALDRVRSHSIDDLQRASPRPGALFRGPSRGPAGSARLTRFGADHLLKQAAVAAGIERPVSANVLRRTHVVSAERAGIPIDDIRQRMGHRDTRTTRRYLAASNPREQDPTP
jgi:integrase/recombinase XerD